jgi:hypothetical protein
MNEKLKWEKWGKLEKWEKNAVSRNSYGHSLVE